MAELISMTYEQARAEHFKALMKKMQRKIDYWQCRGQYSLKPRGELSRANIECSEAGMQYSFYKDALESLEDNKFQYETGFVKGFEAAQPKWISVEKRLPKVGEFVLFKYAKNAQNPTMHARNTMAVGRYEYGMFLVEGGSVKVTHWMPLPSTEGIE